MTSTTKKVSSTDRIFFDESKKTFRLYAGNSLYAMSISPELNLEHLYWGKTLHPGYDLRYLSQSTRPTPFSTLEAAPADCLELSFSPSHSMKDIEKSWKEHKSANVEEDSMEAFHKRRMENFTWRVMAKKAQEVLQTLRGDYPELPKPEKFRSQSPMNISTRRRSATTGNPGDRLDTIESPYKPHFSPEKSIAQLSGRGKALNFVQLNVSKLHYKQAAHAFERNEGTIGKGSLCVEYGDQGTGDFRTPSFIVVDNFNGSTLSPLKYRNHVIYSGKLPMPDQMPGIRCRHIGEASTLVITMADIGSGLEVDLIYVAMHEHDVITRRVEFRNMDSRCRTKETDNGECNSRNNGKIVQKASSMTVDFESPSLPFYMVQLSGSWARERMIVETKLTHGMQSFGSARGVSGHQHNPFAVVTTGPPSETHGEVKAFSLVYSGNFLVEAELNDMGRLRLNMGIHPMGLHWHLRQGKTFSTPEAVMVRSNEGLGGMSRSLHRLFLDNLIPRSWADTEMPVLLNTWEAKYFQVNHANVVEMARQAVKVGVNLVVVDDGWFGKRNNDTTSLGDWVADPGKFPLGISGLAKDINELGCRLGLWFEPEMMSEDSVLFNAHPDWYLHVPGRPRQIGRNQMVLDLSRKEVRDHLFEMISEILSNANVEYIKWDMNRPLTEVYTTAVWTAGQDEIWQGETSHRYVLGVYDLQSRITTKFPHILLENCASGGGRFDPGMLYYSPQIWCSDNTDAIARMRIQYGTSLAYPARTIGSHVSSVPNHITGNTTRVRTRGFVATCGTFGYELDMAHMTAADKLMYQKQVEVFRSVAPVVWWGDLYRLWDPFKMPFLAWMYVSRDKNTAVVFAFSMNSDHWSNLVPRLELQGLHPDSVYEVSEPVPNNLAQQSGNLMIVETEAPMYQLGVNSVCLTGEILMSAGLPVKFYTLDDSVMFTLRCVGSCSTSPRGNGSVPYKMGSKM